MYFFSNVSAFHVMFERGVRIPAATALIVKTGSDISTSKQSAIGVYVCRGSTEMAIINGFPVSEEVWHANEPALLNEHEIERMSNFFIPHRLWWYFNMSETHKWDENLQTTHEYVWLYNGIFAYLRRIGILTCFRTGGDSGFWGSTLAGKLLHKHIVFLSCSLLECQYAI